MIYHSTNRDLHLPNLGPEIHQLVGVSLDNTEQIRHPAMGEGWNSSLPEASAMPSRVVPHPASAPLLMNLLSCLPGVDLSMEEKALLIPKYRFVFREVFSLLFFPVAKKGVSSEL